MRKIEQMILPLMLSVSVGGWLLCGQFTPLATKSFLYWCSLSVTNLLRFIVPFIVMVSLFNLTINIKKYSKKLITLAPMLFFSNFIPMLLSFVAWCVIGTDWMLPAFDGVAEPVVPLWPVFALPVIPMHSACLFSVGCASIALAIVKKGSAIIFLRERSASLSDLIQKWLSAAMHVLLPLLLSGYILKLNHEGMLIEIFKNCDKIILSIIGVEVFYICVLYGVASKWRVKVAFNQIKHILPACITGFFTMSSMSALTLLISGVARNINDKILVRIIAPLCANIHSCGNAVITSALVLIISNTYSSHAISFNDFLIYTCCVCISKFSNVAVPGGIIIVILPILQSRFGFDSSMITLLITLDLILDCVITFFNLLGNGAFMLIFYNLGRKKDE